MWGWEVSDDIFLSIACPGNVMHGTWPRVCAGRLENVVPFCPKDKPGVGIAAKQNVSYVGLVAEATCQQIQHPGFGKKKSANLCPAKGETINGV